MKIEILKDKVEVNDVPLIASGTQDYFSISIEDLYYESDNIKLILWHKKITIYEVEYSTNKRKEEWKIPDKMLLSAGDLYCNIYLYKNNNLIQEFPHIFLVEVLKGIPSNIIEKIL